MEAETTTQRPTESGVKGTNDFLNKTADAIDDIFVSFNGLVAAIRKGDTREIVRAYWHLGSPQRWSFVVPSVAKFTGVKLQSEAAGDVVIETKPVASTAPVTLKK